MHSKRFWILDVHTISFIVFPQTLLVSGWLLDPDQCYDKVDSMFHLHSLISRISSLPGKWKSLEFWVRKCVWTPCDSSDATSFPRGINTWVMHQKFADEFNRQSWLQMILNSFTNYWVTIPTRLVRYLQQISDVLFRPSNVRTLSVWFQKNFRQQFRTLLK